MGARMKIELQPGILLGAPASSAIGGRISGTRLPRIVRRRRWRSFCHCWRFCSDVHIQFNAAALREQWRNEAYTQFDRFLDSKFIFHRAHHRPVGYAAATTTSISAFITLHSQRFLLALMISASNTRITAVKQSCNAVPVPCAALRPIWLAASSRITKSAYRTSTIVGDKCGEYA